MNEDTAVECMKAGADDYVIKEHIKRLGLAAINAMEKKKNELERKQAEEKIRKLSTAVTQSASVIILTDLKGNLEHVNPKFTELTGYTSEEVIGKNPRILKSSGLPDEIYKGMWEIISSGKIWRGEFHNKKKNGELYWEAASISPILDNQGSITHYIKVAEDMTERKRIEDQIRRELKEKELLLREVHHRVKNNLQVISGLLMLQQSEIATKEDALKGFAASQDRIIAMAKAYEMLLGSEYMSGVSVGKYIQSLADQLRYDYDVNRKVKLNYSLNELTISIEILDRLGLILNEIITNSIKYAFEGRESGNIHIELKETEKNIVIKISDDGIGMPEEIDITNPSTLGLSLVEMLTTQLNGILTLDRKNGTSFTLEIPKEREA